MGAAPLSDGSGWLPCASGGDEMGVTGVTQQQEGEDEVVGLAATSYVAR